MEIVAINEPLIAQSEFPLLQWRKNKKKISKNLDFIMFNTDIIVKNATTVARKTPKVSTFLKISREKKLGLEIGT